MQTFLPFPSFAESVAALDTPRLGKQRVETLQILRALLLPTYGWQRHPAVLMWRGHVPALAAYGLAAVDEWRSRGFADATRSQILEFAPGVDGLDPDGLADLLPAWFGDPALHRSHRSRLIAKDPAYYGPRFPGTPQDLDYVWPVPIAEPAAEAEHELWILRVDALDPWREVGLLGLPLVDPRGKAGPARRDQVRAFEDELRPARLVGVLPDDAPAAVQLAEVTGPAAAAVVDGQDLVAVAAGFTGLAVRRDRFPVPAVLQNPRRFFRVGLDEPVAALAAGAEDSTG